MSGIDIVFNSIWYFGLLTVLGWLGCYCLIYKGLKFKGIKDPKYSVVIILLQLLCYIPLSLLSRILFNDLEIWSNWFCVISFIYFALFYIAILYQLPRMNLRNKYKQPTDVNNIFWTLCEIIICILSISYISTLYIHADVQYNTSLVLDLKETLYIGTEITKFVASWGLPAWGLMLLQAIRNNRLRRKYQTLSAIQNDNPPILYLRTFGLDKTPALNNKTFDEYLFSPIANRVVISLANPDEIIPSGGSIKIQSKDDFWKDAVIHLLQDADFVIMALGDTDGIKWEISQLRKHLKPSQVLIVIPPYYYASLAWCDYLGKKRELLAEYGGYASYNWSQIVSQPFTYRRNIKRIRQLWSQFTEKLRAEGLNVSDKFPGFNKILSFDQDWNANCEARKPQEVLKLLSTPHQGNSYSYNDLAIVLQKYEVNGFVPNEYVSKYRHIINKIAMVYGIGTIVLSLCLLLLHFGGTNSFCNKEFKDDIDPETCDRIYRYYIRKNDQISLKHFMSKAYYTLTVISDTLPAYEKGMRGEYVLLEYGNWSQNSLQSIFNVISELKDCPKTITVMNNDTIEQHCFDGFMGVIIGLKCETEEKKLYINKTYDEWKRTRHKEDLENPSQRNTTQLKNISQ